VPQVTEERELIRAQARYVRSSARKARLVLEHIRGKPAVEAQSILAFQTRAVARDAGKVLKSAIANAENNSGHEADELVVVYAYADEGPTLKRWRARARGRVARIRKRTCHITIELAQGAPAAGIPSMPPMAAPEPEPIEEPEALEEPETVDEAEVVEETETAEEPEAAEETEEPAAETETDEPEAEMETPETESEE
jgi:large subunit ribosomal protein L22